MHFWGYKYEHSRVYAVNIHRDGIVIDFWKWQFGVNF